MTAAHHSAYTNGVTETSVGHGRTGIDEAHLPVRANVTCRLADSLCNTNNSRCRHGQECDNHQAIDSAIQLSLSLCISFALMATDRASEDALHSSLPGSHRRYLQTLVLLMVLAMTSTGWVNARSMRSSKSSETFCYHSRVVSKILTNTSRPSVKPRVYGHLQNFQC